MSCVLEVLRARLLLRAAAMSLTAIGIAACSGEASRFNENPFSARSSLEATGSVPQAVPAGRVESRPLASAPASYGATPHDPGMVRPHAPPAPEAAASATPKVTAGGHWTRDGGTAITVAQGETVDAIARRHGVPASAIIQANNLATPGAIHPGQHLVIPRYSQSRIAAGAPASRPASSPHRSTPALAGNPGAHVVAPGETLSKISRLYRKPVSEIARANNIQIAAPLRIGDRLVIPGVRSSAARPPAGPAQAAPAVAHEKPASVARKEPETVPTASVFTPADTPSPKDTVKSAEAGGPLPKFRWPANGRVITGFGPMTNGQKNDGINIALPENTPVKAAEEGVVAYAGNELKGYGNLVLVRHPTGYVTAYAHAKELLVKRGDQVKRGQVIARSGQTGNVNAPQLHFEIRKGASPLDPLKFLGG